MKPTMRFAPTLLGMALAFPAAAATGAGPLMVTQGSEYVMVSDGGTMTSASANEAIGAGEVFTVSGGNARLSQGDAAYDLGPGTYSVGANGAVLDAGGNRLQQIIQSFQKSLQNNLNLSSTSTLTTAFTGLAFTGSFLYADQQWTTLMEQRFACRVVVGAYATGGVTIRNC